MWTEWRISEQQKYVGKTNKAEENQEETLRKGGEIARFPQTIGDISKWNIGNKTFIHYNIRLLIKIDIFLDKYK